MRTKIVIVFLMLCFLAISTLFWYNEWVYSLPTPVPVNYRPVGLGSVVDLPGAFKPSGKPLFLHFFNPDCPCSRFNIGHFKSLVRDYGGQVRFAIVVMNNKNYTEKEIQDKFDIRIPVSFDSSIAVLCGVYSTPQAVIINTDHKLFYRGNYNRSRYCTDNKTNYAQMALEGLLHRNVNLTFDPLALTAYGCRLPNCKK